MPVRIHSAEWDTVLFRNNRASNTTLSEKSISSMIIGASEGKIFIKTKGNPRPRRHSEKSFKSQEEGRRAVGISSKTNVSIDPYDFSRVLESDIIIPYTLLKAMHLDYTEICIDLIPALIYQHMKICLTTMSYIKCPFDVLSNR